MNPRQQQTRHEDQIEEQTQQIYEICELAVNHINKLVSYIDSMRRKSVDAFRNTAGPKWSEHEQHALKRATQEYGSDWEKVAKHVSTRTSLECRAFAYLYLRSAAGAGVSNPTTPDSAYDLSEVSRKRRAQHHFASRPRRHRTDLPLAPAMTLPQPNPHEHIEVLQHTHSQSSQLGQLPLQQHHQLNGLSQRQHHSYLTLLNSLNQVNQPNGYQQIMSAHSNDTHTPLPNYQSYPFQDPITENLIPSLASFPPSSPRSEEDDESTQPQQRQHGEAQKSQQLQVQQSQQVQQQQAQQSQSQHLNLQLSSSTSGWSHGGSPFGN
eukprot:TRINITY_DN8911_c0_g1_i1.p1 TRINITY_DN8911_c0_g1~~TRINITY_DN8911_c0_g1_i1.p1  ORF type:complete len:322 (+),score=72.16 TRINITY_DN8911_c0_g1_i1:134-1099(+)